MQLGLMYGQIAINPALYNITRYVDRNFAKDPTNWKSIMRYFFFFIEVVVS